MPKSEFVFVVDTNLYAGNFSRQLCGYCTGEADEYRGQDEVKVFHEEVKTNPVDDLVEFRPVGDSNPFLSPCDVWPNPAWFNNGLGGEYRLDDPTAEAKALEAHKKFVVARAEEAIAQAHENTKLPDEQRKRLGWTDAAIEQELARQQQCIEGAAALTEVNHHHSYLSVGIFLYSRPSDQQVEFLKDRVHKFVQYCRAVKFLPDDLVIEGFRLVEQTMTETTSCL